MCPNCLCPECIATRKRSHDARLQAREVAARFNDRKPFTPDELRFAATSRCPCGAGIAYPKGMEPMGGFWDCSAILLHTDDKTKTHTDRLPFAFYEIESEDQPSAGGATTRGESVVRASSTTSGPDGTPSHA